MNEKPSYYAIIPANVRYSDLKPNAKLLYGEITALSNKHGFCFASNNYFAELYNVNKNTISSWISELNKKGFITVKIERDLRNVITKRCIGILRNANLPIVTGKPIQRQIPNRRRCNTRAFYGQV